MSNNRERPRAFSVRLFLPGGDPDGVKIVEKSNLIVAVLHSASFAFRDHTVLKELNHYE